MQEYTNSRGEICIGSQFNFVINTAGLLVYLLDCDSFQVQPNIPLLLSSSSALSELIMWQVVVLSGPRWMLF